MSASNVSGASAVAEGTHSSLASHGGPQASRGHGRGEESSDRGGGNDDDDDDVVAARRPWEQAVENAVVAAASSVGRLRLLERTLVELWKLREQYRRRAMENDPGTTTTANEAVDRTGESIRELSESLTSVKAELVEVFSVLESAISSVYGGGGDSDELVQLAVETVYARTVETVSAPSHLDRIPRVVLTPQSTVFADATVSLRSSRSSSSSTSRSSTTSCTTTITTTITTTTTQCRAVPGDFGANHLAHRITNATVVYCGTGKGGIDSQTMEQIRNILRSSLPRTGLGATAPPSPLVLLFDRGGDITFVRKGLLAQRVGAHAAIIANHVSQPWPFQMSDSAHEAQHEQLQIPVVMIRTEDAQSILMGLRPPAQQVSSGGASSETLTCDVEILPAGKSSDCALCLQPMQEGETILVMPNCRHAFHYECAAMWLWSHITCPYCRSDLPTAEADPTGGDGIGNSRNDL